MYQITLSEQIDAAEASRTLQLAAMAAEGLFGAARVRMEFRYETDLPERTFRVDGGSPVGEAVLRMFVGFLTREFGAAEFSVKVGSDE